ncbi:MAG: hypothetical protein JW737_07190 [Acidobacteria bacterium]|nr:hypothetical protein [Acidobacteriota bacterium]
MTDKNQITGDSLDEILDFIIERFSTVLGYRQIPWAISTDDLPDIDQPVFFLSGTTQLTRNYNSGYVADCRDNVHVQVLYQIKNQDPVAARKSILEECSRVETEFIKNTVSDNFSFNNFSKSIDIHNDNYFLVTVELEVNYERSL